MPEEAIGHLGPRRVSARVLLALLLAGYFTLALAYGWLNPVFEAPDELWHFLYVDHLQRNHALPVQDPLQKEGGPRQEGSQPPMYYLVAAALGSLTRADDLPAYQQLNPRHRMGDIFAPDERNLIFHTEKESVSFSATARAVHLARLLSTVLGLVTVLLTYAAAREVLPAARGLALFAAAYVAFLPQFAFLSAAVNNDNLAIAMATLCLWLLLRVRRRPSPLLLVLLGLAAGIASLSKLSAVGLAPVIALGLLVPASPRETWRPRLRRLAIVAATALVVAGWWYARNLFLYGDPFGLNVMLAMVGVRDRPPDLAGLLAELWLIKASFWALFGWTNVPADGWFYLVTDFIMLLGLAGVVLRLVRRPDAASRPREFWLLLIWIIVAALALANWNRLTVAPQGRLLFSALAPLAILLAWGLTAFHWRGVPIAAVAVVIAIPALAAYALFAYLVPSYHTLPVMARGALGDNFTPRPIDFGAQYRLLGFRLSEQSLHSGQTATVTLYWQRRDPSAPGYVRFLHLEAPGEPLFAGGDAVLGADLPPAIWSGEDVLRDVRLLSVPVNADAPLLADLTVGLYEPDSQRRLPAQEQSGVPLGDAPTIARLRVLPNALPLAPDAERSAVQLGDEVALAADLLPSHTIHAGQSLRGLLYWRALATPRADYTVFVHLAREGKPVAQYDAQPRRGRYPTSAWQPSEIVPDDFVIPTAAGIPPGDYRLLVGLYDLATGQRLGSPVDLGVITLLP